MECSLALCFKDFAMLATDKTSARSIMVMKDGKQSFQKPTFQTVLKGKLLLQNCFAFMFYEINFVKDDSFPTESDVYLWDSREAFFVKN